MKCPMCSGKGMVDYPMYADDEHKWQYCVARMKKCDMCNGTGEVPITNEEWIKSLDTEQLAKRLHNNDVYAFFVCKNGGKVPSMESYVEWLKQPHTEKE